MKGCAPVVVILCLCIISSTSGKKKTTPVKITTKMSPTKMTHTPTKTTSMTTLMPSKETPSPIKTTAYPTSTTSSPMPTTTAPPPYCESQYSCVDCWTARICTPTASGHLQELYRFNCSTDYWCDPSSGTCTPEVTEACDPGPVVGNYSCMREGYFPVPDDCNRYYRCAYPDYVPNVFKCPVNKPFYIPAYQACMASCYEPYCFNNDTLCAGYNGVKVPVPNTNNMFLFCEDGLPVIVDRCIGAYQFNSTSQMCEPACPHEGLFPSDEDCTKYYRCSPTSTNPSETNFSMTLNITCPPGQAFLQEAYECVNRTIVPNCNTSALGLTHN